MAAQVAAGQPGQGVLGVARRAGAHPVLQQHVAGLVAVQVGAAAEQARQGRERDQVGRGLAARVDPDPLGGQAADQLGPRQRAAGEHLGQRGHGPPADAVVKAELEAPAPAGGREHRAEQGHQPAGVLGRDQVQGPAHRPEPDHRPVLVAGAADGRLVKAAAAGTQGQPRRRGVLGLEAAERRHHLPHPAGPATGQQLGAQPVPPHLVLGAPGGARSGHRPAPAGPGPRQPGPLSTRPARRPAKRPCSTTGSPPRTTCSMPVTGTSGSR